MATPSWQLTKPISAFVFDCDGTLSTIEGIDELAKWNGVGNAVELLTSEAMGKTGINVDLYQKRLELVNPTYGQVTELGQHYAKHCVPDIKAIINILTRLNKTIYLVSAGLQPALSIFGELLTIPQKNIFGVKIHFDEQQKYKGFDSSSALTNNQGKRTIVKELKSMHSELIYVGDGLNDLAAYDLVTRFIGYGGSFYRKNIASHCEFYINTPSMAPVLALGLTEEEYKKLHSDEKIIYGKGVESIREGKVKISKIV